MRGTERGGCSSAASVGSPKGGLGSPVPPPRAQLCPDVSWCPLLCSDSRHPAGPEPPKPPPGSVLGPHPRAPSLHQELGFGNEGAGTAWNGGRSPERIFRRDFGRPLVGGLNPEIPVLEMREGKVTPSLSGICLGRGIVTPPQHSHFPRVPLPSIPRVPCPPASPTLWSTPNSGIPPGWMRPERFGKPGIPRDLTAALAPAPSVTARGPGRSLGRKIEDFGGKTALPTLPHPCGRKREGSHRLQLPELMVQALKGVKSAKMRSKMQNDVAKREHGLGTRIRRGSATAIPTFPAVLEVRAVSGTSM